MGIKLHEFKSNYGPWVLITGASNGIGAALATEVASYGLKPILVARSHDRLQQLSSRLQADYGVEVMAAPADLGAEDGVQQTLNRIEGMDIGLYAACAGFGTAGPFVNNSIEDELNMIDVNCRALAALAHPIAQNMRKRGRGGVILMSSIVAFQGVGKSANYAASKAYVQSFAEGLAAELHPYGIDVLASAPGPVDTGFATRADMKLGTAASAESVARATLRALGRTTTVRPGVQSKLLGYSLSTLPRFLRSRILGQIMTEMTKHRDGKA